MAIARAWRGVLAFGLAGAVGCAAGADAGLDSFDDGDEAGAQDASSPVDDSSGPASTHDTGSGSSLDASTPDTSPGAHGDSGDSGGSEVATADSGGAIVEASTGDGAVAPLPPALGQWSFEEGSGTTSADLSGNGHAATLVGGATWSTAGKKGGGLALDGATGYADVGVPLIDTAASFTVLAWAKLAVVATWEVALSEDDVTGSLFGLKLRGDGSNEFDFDVEKTDTTNPAFVVAQSTVVAQAQVWVHLVGVYDASGSGAMKMYVNGALQSNAAVGQALPAAAGHFLIGRGLYNSLTGSFFDGTLDEIAVYGAALSDAQVARVYSTQE